LNHMITVRVTNALQNVSIQLLDEDPLMFRRDELDSLLDYSATVHMLCELENMSFHGGRELTSLHWRPVFEKFLNDIIAEDILYKVQGVLRYDLIKHRLPFFLSTLCRVRCSCSAGDSTIDRARPAGTTRVYRRLPRQRVRFSFTRVRVPGTSKMS